MNLKRNHGDTEGRGEHGEEEKIDKDGELNTLFSNPSSP
jgi:hypothetical protein